MLFFYFSEFFPQILLAFFALYSLHLLYRVGNSPSVPVEKKKLLATYLKLRV